MYLKRKSSSGIDVVDTKPLRITQARLARWFSDPPASPGPSVSASDFKINKIKLASGQKVLGHKPKEQNSL